MALGTPELLTTHTKSRDSSPLFLLSTVYQLVTTYRRISFRVRSQPVGEFFTRSSLANPRHRPGTRESSTSWSLGSSFTRSSGPATSARMCSLLLIPFQNKSSFLAQRLNQETVFGLRHFIVPIRKRRDYRPYCCFSEPPAGPSGVNSYRLDPILHSIFPVHRDFRQNPHGLLASDRSFTHWRLDGQSRSLHSAVTTPAARLAQPAHRKVTWLGVRVNNSPTSPSLLRAAPANSRRTSSPMSASRQACLEPSPREIPKNRRW